jgi:hypothetical protein
MATNFIVNVIFYRYWGATTGPGEECPSRVKFTSRILEFGGFGGSVEPREGIGCPLRTAGLVTSEPSNPSLYGNQINEWDSSAKPSNGSR